MAALEIELCADSLRLAKQGLGTLAITSVRCLLALDDEPPQVPLKLLATMDVPAQSEEIMDVDVSFVHQTGSSNSIDCVTSNPGGIAPVGLHTHGTPGSPQQPWPSSHGVRGCNSQHQPSPLHLGQLGSITFVVPMSYQRTPGP